MEIKKTYYGKINGYDAMTCDFIPDNMVIEKEENILYPDDGYMLEKDGIEYDSVILDNEHKQEDYVEKEIIIEEEL